MHTGYRAYSRELLLEVPFLRNALDFSFDSEMIMQAVALRLPHRRGAGAHAATSTTPPRSRCGPSIVYGLKTLWAGVRLVLHRSGIWRSRKFEP